MSEDPVRLFVFGLGYSAGEFARRMKSRAASVAGTVRSEEKADRLRTEGIAASVFDGTGPGTDVGKSLADATHLVVSIAPGEEGDPVLRHHAADILAAPKLRWIGYLSTVGVYGNYGGAWVSERTTPHARPGRSIRRLEAEKAWQRLGDERETPLAIFRIAGIYGPGRNALRNLEDGTARRIIKPGQVFNRIHVADIAATLLVAIEKNATGILNLADDEPCPPQDVVEFAANLMGVPVPPKIPFESADLSPMARSFYGESKRVLNRRLREDLGVDLRYPTYREGLDTLWKGGNWRGPEND
jgi:nucleoside-diphosphate-sugar epimerase